MGVHTWMISSGTNEYSGGIMVKKILMMISNDTFHDGIFLGIQKYIIYGW